MKQFFFSESDSSVCIGHCLMAVVTFLLLVIAFPLRAQNSLGSIQGSVMDEAKRVVPGAEVTVINQATGVSISTKTNDRGFYNVPSLVPGDQYIVRAGKSGFDVVEVNPVSTTTGDVTTIDITLPVGKESISITVSAESQMLSHESATVATNLDEQLTGNLPYPEQGSLEVALLAPGVKGSQTSPSGLQSENPGVFTATVAPGAQISINGASAGHSAILVDGADVTQSSYARAGITVSSGMVGQVTVISNGVPAQYGRTLGGVVISSTKSGTNLYHGRLSWRHTDPAFQAYPDGSTIPAALHQNFFGAFLGGPVRIPKLYNGKDKTFFFLGIEPARLGNKTSSYGIVLTPDELQGKFHDDINLLDQTIVSTQGYSAARAAARTQSIHYQSALNAQGFPTGPQYTSNKSYLQVPNDDLSAQFAQNPLAKFLASQMPTPSNPQNTVFLRPDGYYVDSGPGKGTNASEIRGVHNSDNRYSVRIDHVIGSYDRMYARFTSTPVTASRFGVYDITSPLTPWQLDTSRANNVIVDETHVFSGSLINEIKVSYLRNDQNRLPPAAALTKDWGASLGLLSATAGAGFPTLQNLGYNVGTNTIVRNVDSTSLIQDDVTIIRGRHKLMVGVDLRRLQSNQYSNPGLYGGTYNFNTSQTAGCQNAFYAGTTTTCTSGGGVGFASLALGLINTFSNQTAQTPAYYRWQYYGGYVQDDFRVHPKLTLNIGLRYELETPRQEINDQQGTFIPGASGSLNGVAATGAFCFTNACGLGHTIFPINYKGFEPRIGFAASPMPRLTVRGSYALLRVPLTGLGNLPLPNFGLSGNSVGPNTGGVNPNQPVDFISNPIAGNPTSALSALQGSRGPFFTVPSGLPIPYVRQSSAVPYSQQWSFTVQFQLLRKTIVEAGYNGAHGVHLFNNNAVPQNFPDLNKVFAQIAAGANFSSTTINNPYGIVQNGAVVKENLLASLLPYQNFFNQTTAPTTGAGETATQIGELYNRDGSSSYNSLYISGTHRFDRGLSLQASFTWSKSLDNNGADAAASFSSGFAGSLQNPYDRSHEWAVSDYDVPARFIAGFTYQVPFGRKARFALPTTSSHALLNGGGRAINAIFGNLNVGGIFRAESSTPFLPTLGTTSTTGGAPGYWFSTGGGTVVPSGIYPRPNIVPGMPCINAGWGANASTRFSQPYINASAFSVPGSLGAPAFGNAPRTMANCRSPRQINLDANLSKRIPFGDGKSKYIEVTMTAQNAINHPVFFFNGGTVNNSIGNNGKIFTSYGSAAAPFSPSPQFGLVNPAATAQFSRVVQVGASINF